MTSSFPYHYEQSVTLRANAPEVFEHLDDFSQLGEHMTRSSWMMAGSRMQYEFDEGRGRQRGAQVRLIGSVLGIKLQIEERVIERSPPTSKSWQTIGHPRMIVLDGYRMGFALTPVAGGCRLQVFIEYAPPQGRFGRWLGRIAGGPYARWCVNSMIGDAATRFGQLTEEPAADRNSRLTTPE